VVKVARMLKKHLPGLLNYFRHPITNAISEGFNSKIQYLKAAARGFRNFAHYKNMNSVLMRKTGVKTTPSQLLTLAKKRKKATHNQLKRVNIQFLRLQLNAQTECVTQGL
jgi:hypothetical protein